MKTYLNLLFLLIPLLLTSQIETNDEIIINKTKQDDIYLAGEKVKIKALVNGDAVAAAGEIIVKDSINGDLIIAGGELRIEGHISDDIRAAGGTLIIDAIVDDDIIIAGGDITITEDAIIKGNLIAFSGRVKFYGTVKGTAKITGGEVDLQGDIEQDLVLKGGDVLINGQIKGKSTLIVEELEIGEKAKFYGNIQYWSDNETVDFGESLVNVKASYDEALAFENSEFSLQLFGVPKLGSWVFYLVSAFLIITLLNILFKTKFSEAATHLNTNITKSIGYGLLYVFGLPLVIVLLFVIIFGIPFGIFLLIFYLFSLFFGPIVAALLAAHYLNQRSNKSWNFWKMLLIALSISIVFRLFMIIPFIGVIITGLVIVVTYGLLSLLVVNRNKQAATAH
ncbi:hypothetical protein ABN763_00870 [Spongiivirga sp. MCCC 1A20706]|uniref:hypothetical protein n=1 Tax=Spongiivirga sp. MCCC 1A20706 TaxID=3160963 RepID=UPI003977D3DD